MTIMESKKVCKICGLEKPIYDFGKKDKFKYRTECKVCYNQMRRDFNKLSEGEKLKVKEESKLREEKRLMKLKKKRDEKELEKETNKRLNHEKLVIEYELRMNEKINKRKTKNYLCRECGDTEVVNFYSTRKNKCKKCLLLKPNTGYMNMSDEERGMVLQRQKKWVSNNIIRVRVESSKHRAIRKGLVFELTDEIIQQKLNEQEGKCYVSKQPLIIKENNWYGLSLDRLDNNLGYTIDNTVLVTKFVNLSKNNLSLDEYLKLLKEVCNNI